MGWNDLVKGNMRDFRRRNGESTEIFKFCVPANDEGEAEGLVGRWQPRGMGRVEVWSGVVGIRRLCGHRGLSIRKTLSAQRCG
jgi:hypothetical protein